MKGWDHFIGVKHARREACSLRLEELLSRDISCCRGICSLMMLSRKSWEHYKIALTNEDGVHDKSQQFSTLYIDRGEAFYG